ncbi:3-oxoacyl-[acyl-carrier-protein] synthase III C-terminal domain-containing protein [Paraburkholderia bannensis]|uniref:3-oxoacyl-[acyl-carrier-protein] synthase III C-terminal domain-containing protein n=1 Tax=Paraburkholderia bannensis TaxID=765414 RepID=UPI002AB17132|nr:3-oxoacyl-[acyl-carrier-protein] synthase III C-terminal domain-containing protein [Paraburkholderia bannensis]
MSARLLATGIYLPEKSVPVASLLPDGVDSYQTDVVGIHSVRRAAPDEHASDLAIKAGREALKASALDPRDIDVVIYCGIGVNDRGFWSPAARIQHELGASRAFAFDVYQGCVNTILALKLARDMLNANEKLGVVLIVAGCRVEDVIPGRTTGNTFYSDGGAAALVVRDGDDWVIGDAYFETDGYFHDVFYSGSGGTIAPPTHPDSLVGYGVQNREKQKIDLKPVFDEKLIGVIERLAGHLSHREIYVNLFNYNRRLTATLNSRFAGRVSGWLASYESYGHMGPCDPILNLHLAREQHQIPPGAVVINVAAGIGMTWGGCAIEH